MKKLIIDEDTCVCCGSCTAICDEVFGWTDEGTTCVKSQEKIEENKEAVENAINACPTGAIKYVEAAEEKAEELDEAA